jgi:hypothetical protein
MDLLEQILAVPMRDRDAWVDRFLGLQDPPADVAMPDGSVPYLPCGVEEILALVREAPLRADDELVDLGSGLGRVLMLAHLLTGARGRGIEIQQPLVELARERCAALKLPITFTHANAADVELQGSAFFFYAPFNGETLTRVLQRLEKLALRRSIKIGAVGLELRVPWLRARASSCVSLTLYDSI